MLNDPMHPRAATALDVSLPEDQTISDAQIIMWQAGLLFELEITHTPHPTEEVLWFHQS